MGPIDAGASARTPMSTRLTWSLAVCLVVAAGTFAARKVSHRTISELERARDTLDARELPREAAIAFALPMRDGNRDRKSTRLNSSHVAISYAVFCLKKKN